jgi:hypothetical protein
MYNISDLAHSGVMYAIVGARRRISQYTIK